MTEKLITTLQAGVSELGYTLSDQQIEKFNDYYHYLIEMNNNINLTSITEPEEVAIKHFADSMTCFQIGLADHAKIIDIGSGAGFPGVVLKIVNKTLSIVMLDSLQKRVDYLNNLVSKLKLEKIAAIHGRAEDAGRDVNHREKYDIVVSRAVANLATLSEYCLPFAKVGGSFIAMKGPKASKEITEAKKAIQLLGGEIEKVVEIKLPLNGDERTLVKIKKVKHTPDKYPRKAGTPGKKPLR